MNFISLFKNPFALSAWLGPMLFFGGGGSSSANTTDNYNIDRRVATDSGSVGVSGDNNSISVQSLDKDVAIKAIDTNASSYNALLGNTASILNNSTNVQAGNYGALLDTTNSIVKSNATSLDKLIDSATSMFNTSEGLIGQTQKSVADAYSTAVSEKSGTIDNKTIVVLAVAGAVAAFAFAGRKK